jgi:hypothetical protein
MAEYCSQCSPFKEEGEFDFDLFNLALKVKRGHSINFLCEGCNNRGIYKDEQGLIYLLKDENRELIFQQVNIEDL